LLLLMMNTCASTTHKLVLKVKRARKSYLLTSYQSTLAVPYRPIKTSTRRVYQSISSFIVMVLVTQ
jgi:hypothetical protein